MMKNVLFVLLVLVSFGCATAQSVVTVGPYLQSPTSTSIKILWRSDVAATSKVMYGTSIGNLNQTVTDTATTQRHAIQITGLTPYTKYYYAIYDGNTKLEGDDADHSFRTFPLAGTELPIRVWAIGDFGKGNTKQARVRDAYLNFDTTETDLWIWLGDNVYDDGEESEYLTKVFDSVYGYKKVMKRLPFLPSPGNHDYNVISPALSTKAPLTHTGPYYDFVDVYKNGEAGGVASGHELYYSYDYGNVHFISFNSELGSPLTESHDWTGARIVGSAFTSSPLTQWLEQDLAANTKPWVVIYFHQPPYTDGSHESTAFYEVYMKAMRKYMAPIWEQYGVDLVVCGHTHVYERSALVRGAYGDDFNDITTLNFVDDNSASNYIKYTQGPKANFGTVYVNNGNSGSSESSPNFQHPYMKSEYGCDTCCGSLVLDINGNTLVGRHIDMNGQERDRFTITKANSTGVDELNSNGIINNLNVIPNPFKNTTQVQFELKQSGPVKAELSDITGKTIDVFGGNLQQGPQTFEINADNLKLAKGVYVLRIASDGKNVAKTVIKID